MQKKKNIRLLLALIMVVTVVTLLHYAKSINDNLGVEKTIFQLADQQEITDVFLESAHAKTHFKYQKGRWTLNDTLFLDQSMRDVFFSVLSRIEVQKPVPQLLKDSIVSYLKTSGVKATITFGDEVISEYWIGGNKELEISWAMDSKDEIPYQVHIAGYQSYIAGIFDVPVTDWRSRFVFNINFALLHKIEIEYAKTEENLELYYKNNFFEVPDIIADSTKIANFLDRLAYLQADSFIEQNKITDEYDSLIQNRALFATLKMIKTSGEVDSITFYQKPFDKKFIFAKTNDKSLCKFNFARIKGIFRISTDFE